MDTRRPQYPVHSSGTHTSNSNSIPNHQQQQHHHHPPPSHTHPHAHVPAPSSTQQQQQQSVDPHSYPPPPQASHGVASLSSATPPLPQSHYPYPAQPPTSTSAPPSQQHLYPHHRTSPHSHQHPHQHHPPPPPPPPLSTANSLPPSSAPQQSPHHQYPSPQSAPPTTGAVLPRIQQPGYQSSPTSATPHDSQNLPPFRHPSQPGPSPHSHSHPAPPLTHESRDQNSYQSTPYPGHGHNSHETPGSGVSRTYSHESAHQHTPTTPVQPAPFSSSLGPNSHPSSAMDHGPPHPSYAPPVSMAHGPPPPHSMPPPHHDQYMNPVMDGPHGYPASQHMFQYGPTSAMFAGAPSKRKQMRASQACEQCRQRKQKCDEGTPCSFCKESNLPCVYRDAAPPKTDKNLEKLMNIMETNAGTLQQLASKMDEFSARLQKIEGAAGLSSSVPLGASNSAGADNSTANGGPGSPDSADEEAIPEEPRPPKRKAGMDDHRTAPHKLLLLWPSIKPMLMAADTNMKDSYVMEAEDRGVLRLYTRGEGMDEFDGTQNGGPASPARSEESGEATMPSPPEGVWGTGFPMTPPGSESRRVETVSPGGMKADNTLDLDVNTINSLLDSFMKNMHIMHPFVDRHRLRRMFDSFIHSYATGRRPATFVVSQNGNDFERPPKRQRSNGPTGLHSSFGSISEHVIKATERSPTNAIVYLVMALGKLYQHQGPIPGPLPDNKTPPHVLLPHQVAGMRGSAASSSPSSTKIKPSPTSPPITTPIGLVGHATPPPMELSQSRSRRSSFDSGGGHWTRNLDAIPGMAYYTKAIEILGDQADGTDLVHAQMFLLAGLYKGALARVKESMSWFSMAGRALRILLDRYKLFNDDYWKARGDVKKSLQQGQKQIKDKRTNLIVLASWTCLQLETDILAELPLPSSGIQDLEGMLLLPHKMTDTEDNEMDGVDPNIPQEDYDNIMYYYTAQFWLRKRLNLIHRELYGAEALGQTIEQVQMMLRSHESILDGWRSILAPHVRWNDSDPPASNILDARLRAKYWGARYVVNRPFLDYALHIMPLVKDGHELSEIALDANNQPRARAEIHLFEAIQGMPEAEVWQASRRCIEAAMQSTVAFDGMPGRLIVTNIHGTAHAQFGNMLVLSATYNSTVLKALVNPERFSKLLVRTIQFLKRIPNSATCRIDCGILEKLHRFLFGVSAPSRPLYYKDGVDLLKHSESVHESQNSSFSSNHG